MVDPTDKDTTHIKDRSTDTHYEIMTLKITLKISSNAEKPGNKRNE